MEFKQNLKKYQYIVNEELEKYLRKDECPEKILNNSMEYSLMAGGKRLRPILVLATYELFRDDFEEAMPFAVAIEMIHNFSLIHDDLPEVDNDDFRHGKPTNHKQFNHPTALLAGDGLLNNAYIVISNEMLYSIENQYKENFHSRAKAFNEFTKAVDRMIAGEYLDTELEGKEISKEMLEYIHINKTGALLKLCVRMGAILAEASEKDLERLTTYAEKIGLAFQIKDDILSEEGNPEITGKPVGNDKEMGKCTYVSYYGLDGAKKELDKIKLNGEYKRPEVQRNYKGFDYSKYLKQLKIYGTIKCSKIEVLDKKQVNKMFQISNQMVTKVIDNTKNILDAIENLHTSSESNYSLELNNNDMKEIINNINYLINEGRNNSNKINESLNSLIDKIKNQIKDLDKSSQEDSMYENLDTVGILNQSKIDEYKSSKGTSNDIEYLENIVSADDNSYINSFVGINEFNTVYRNSTSNDIPQPVTEIRQEFITEDIIKSVKYMKNSDLEELNVKLNPRNLGEISIKLSKNKEHSNLLITVDDNNILDLVNKNIEDIKKHLNDTDINIKDIVINVKSENENLFSDNLNKEFNQDRRFNQNNSNKNKKNNNQIIEELHNSEHNKDDDNLNILI